MPPLSGSALHVRHFHSVRQAGEGRGGGRERARPSRERRAGVEGRAIVADRGRDQKGFHTKRGSGLVKALPFRLLRAERGRSECDHVALVGKPSSLVLVKAAGLVQFITELFAGRSTCGSM